MSAQVLKNKYVLMTSPHDTGDKWMGRIVDVFDDRVIIELYSWITYDPLSDTIIKVSDLDYCQLYTDIDAWTNACVEYSDMRSREFRIALEKAELDEARNENHSQ